eukprot:g6139.t1
MDAVSVFAHMDEVQEYDDHEIEDSTLYVVMLDDTWDPDVYLNADEKAVESKPPTSSGKRKREPSFGGNSNIGGVGDPKAQTPEVPTEVKDGLAYFPGAVSVQRLSDGERQHIESRLRYQRAYDSVDIISNGKPVTDGIDLKKTPVLAGVIDKMARLVGVRPDCVHMTTREGGQLDTSHSEKMKFDLCSSVHLGADVLLDGQADPTKSTGDFILSNGSLRQPLVMTMRSGGAYVATPKVLHAPFLHVISPPDQASLSVVCTWTPGSSAFNLFRGKTRPLAESFPSLRGVKAVDGGEAFQVTTTDRVPPRMINARVRQSGDFTDGASLFRAPPEEQASAFHRLGEEPERRKACKGPCAAGERALYDRENGDDGRFLSSEQGASIRPADTSEKWKSHAVEELNDAEPATCSNCQEPGELSWFFNGGSKRRVVVLHHMVGGESGGVRCSKFPKKTRGVFKPIKKVKTITKEVKTIIKEVKTIIKKVKTITKEVKTITKEVKTITKEGIRQAVKREARMVPHQASRVK